MANAPINITCMNPLFRKELAMKSIILGFAVLGVLSILSAPLMAGDGVHSNIVHVNQYYHGGYHGNYHAGYHEVYTPTTARPITADGMGFEFIIHRSGHIPLFRHPYFRPILPFSSSRFINLITVIPAPVFITPARNFPSESDSKRLKPKKPGTAPFVKA